MSILARLKNIQGGLNPIPSVKVASAGTITIGGNDSVILITSSAAINTATTVVFNNPSPIRPGRTITLINGNSSNAITLKYTATASALENYVGGKADIAIDAADVCVLVQTNAGYWLPVSVQDNS